MKIIDLLNKIAKGEEVPHFIIDEQEYYVGTDGFLKAFFGDDVEWCVDKDWLNEEVQVIEEEKKIPEKFKINYEIDEENTINMEKATMLECDLACRINEILDYLKDKEE